LGFSYSFVEERIQAYKEQLRKRGITAAQAALEARAAALKSKIADPNSNPPLTPGQERKIAQQKRFHDAVEDYKNMAPLAQQVLQDAANKANNPDKSTIIQLQPPANPHGPLKST
jgi:hypothetical protein